MRVQQQAVKVTDPENLVPPWDLKISKETRDIHPDKTEVIVKISAAPVHSFDNYLTYPKTYIQAPSPSVPGLEGEYTRLLACSRADLALSQIS